MSNILKTEQNIEFVGIAFRKCIQTYEKTKQDFSLNSNELDQLAVNKFE